jgi:hypothetical protein
MTQRPSAPSKTGEGRATKSLRPEKSAAILIQLDREVASIGDNFNKILKLPDPAYSRRFIELCVCD